MKKTIHIVFLMTFFLAMSACGKEADISDTGGMVTSLHAEYPVYDTAQELVDKADLIFSGIVESVSYEMLDVRTESGSDTLTGISETQDIPYTIYEIKLTKIYKGNTEGDIIHIKQPGGEFDGNTYMIDGATAIHQGETYLFLTETYESSYPSLLNATQAAYDMNAGEMLSEEENKAITLSQILEVLEQ